MAAPWMKHASGYGSTMPLAGAVGVRAGLT
jgi:hypothetical protein